VGARGTWTQAGSKAVANHKPTALNRNAARSAPFAVRVNGCTCTVTCAVTLALLALSAAGCGPRPAGHTQLVASTGPAGATLFRLDADATQIWLLLQADGPLARIGHNHVISTHGLQGSVWLHPQLERSSCALQLPVAAFVVDDPQERAAAGGEYAEPLDADARTGTRAHMLGDRQLDATQFPLVSLQCRRLTAAVDGVTVELQVTLRGRESQLTVPVKWQRVGTVLRASGEFSFRQTAVGLEPYSLLFGALRVSDEIRVRYQLLARAS
jgi:polyisoprenoid-binding protein YceI